MFYEDLEKSLAGIAEAYKKMKSQETVEELQDDQHEEGMNPEGFTKTPHMIASLFSQHKDLFDNASRGKITPELRKKVSDWGQHTPWGINTDTYHPEWQTDTINHLVKSYYPSWNKQNTHEKNLAGIAEAYKKMKSQETLEEAKIA